MDRLIIAVALLSLPLCAFAAGRKAVVTETPIVRHAKAPKGTPGTAVSAKQADKMAGLTKLWPEALTVVDGGKSLTVSLAPSDGTYTLRGLSKKVVANSADEDDTLAPVMAALVTAVKTASGSTVTPRAISFYSADAQTPYSMVAVIPDAADPKKTPSTYAVADVYDPATPVALRTALEALVSWVANQQK